MLQLDLFEKNETVILLEEIRKVKESSEAVRRGVFRRIAEFERLIKEMQQMRQQVG